MELRDDLDVGAATHTGPVRSANEDDFLLLEPKATSVAEAVGRLFVVADGMGGVSGGAEASRTAVRALAATYLEPGPEDAGERMRSGFAVAAREVHRASLASAQLADMGTTMTALNIRAGRAVIGHVGDSRCLLVRGGTLEQLTEDHAVEEPRHLLTRCLGAGRDSEEVDVIARDLVPGDVFALVTDGVWDAVDDAAMLQALRTGAAPVAAERLVQLAIESGTTDNATAVVVRVLSVGRLGQPRSVELPAGEAILPLAAPELELHPLRWPWIVLVGGLAAAGLAVAKLLGLL